MRRAGARLSLALTGAAFAGSCSGTALVLLHTRWISGSFAQSSAQMKLHWSGLQGYSPSRIRTLLRTIVSPTVSSPDSWAQSFANVVGTGFVIWIIAALLWIIGRRLWKGRRTDTPVRETRDLAAISVASGIAVAGYVLFYSFDSAGIQPWYIANLLVPAALLVGALLGLVGSVAPALPAAFFGVHLFLAPLALEPIWPHQEGMYVAAQTLDTFPDDMAVGAWNAGILGHLAKQNVVNLDGLVNDAIYPFASTGRLMDYIHIRHLNYIVDFSAMLTRPGLFRARGLTKSQAENCFTKIRILSPETPPWLNSLETLYRVKPNCS